MPEFKDLSGKKFGRWYVVKRTDDHISKSGYHFTQYECRCECGSTALVLASALKSGRSKSCGCLHSEQAADVCRSNFKAHGESKTRLYKIYHDMIKRCYNPNTSNYKNYGARGITVCDEWLNGWESFKDWANANGYDESLTIDRRDVDGCYCPENCRWVTRAAQANNRRTSRYITHQDETHTVAEWAKLLDIPYKYLHKKLSKGMSISEIVATN